MYRVNADWNTTNARAQALQLEAFDLDQQLGVLIQAGRRLKPNDANAESCTTSAETCIQEMGTEMVEARGLTGFLTQTGTRKRAHLFGLVDTEMLQFCTVMTSALLASEVS